MAWLVFGEDRYVRAVNTKNIGRINIVLTKEDRDKREVVISIEYTNGLKEDIINVETKASFTDIAAEMLNVISQGDRAIFFLDEVIRTAEWKTGKKV